MSTRFIPLEDRHVDAGHSRERAVACKLCFRFRTFHPSAICLRCEVAHAATRRSLRSRQERVDDARGARGMWVGGQSLPPRLSDHRPTDPKEAA